MAAVVKWILLVPVAALAIMLAIANRGPVTVIFDPFPPASSGLTISAPLFLVVLVSIIFGVLLGGFGAWLRQGRYRRAARQARADADRQRVETDRLRSQINAFASLPSHASNDQRVA